MKNNYVKHYVAGAILLWGIAYISIATSSPKIYSPYSLIVILLGMTIYELFQVGKLTVYLLSSFVIPLLFLLWSLPLLSGQTQIIKRSKIITILLVLLSLVWLIASWSYGIQYQGITHTVAVDIFNVMFWLVLFLLYRINRTSPSYTSNYFFHWLLFAWLGWVAFPWLGELP